MSRERKPWEIPMSYNEDRFVDPQPSEARSLQDIPSREITELDENDVIEMLNRPNDRDAKVYECNDTTPVNYGKGPHNEVLGVEEAEFDAPDDHPLDYESGPHDQEFDEDEE